MEETPTRQRPLWAALTKDSSREEVLAAVEEADRRAELARRDLLDVVFPGMPEDPSQRRGCYWSADGDVVACYGDGELEENPAIVRQRAAGEEDQTVPGWDFGA